MKTILFFIIALLFLQDSSFSQRSVKSTTFTNDLALVRPLINTNDSSGGYYSEYFYYDFNFMYCGAIVKNEGTAAATHIFLEIQISDYLHPVLTTYYSDTLAQLNPGQTATIVFPGPLTFQPWISNTTITQFKFIVKSDAVDENPVNDSQTIPFTSFSYMSWSKWSRSIYLTTSIDVSQSGNFQSGDFLGFTISAPNDQHMFFYMMVYLPQPWPESSTITGKLYVNGQLLDTAHFTRNSAYDSGWIMSDYFMHVPNLDPGNLYYAGIEISYNSGVHFNIGADTAVFHNFSSEAIARISGSWFNTLTYVPLIEMINDPEGIREVGKTPVRVFPNPVSGTLFVSKAGDARIEIFDITGKLVLTDTKSADTRQLDMSGLAPGFYMLRITGKDGTGSRKIIVG